MELKIAGMRAIVTEVADRHILFKALSERHGNLPRSHENGQMMNTTQKFATMVTDDLIDGYGHMNMMHYLGAFSRAADVRLDFAIRLSPDGSVISGLVTAEARVAYKKEAMRGDDLLLTTWIADIDEKRVHVAQAMVRGDGTLLSTAEQLFLNFNLLSRRVEPFLPDVMAELRRSVESDSGTFDPGIVSRRMGIPRLV
ncbi:thioesterase family protein (plasmid) [Sinorhizobium numidicum]|uniref:Thioesterase family protein n=1 Tax=Sinorhizobium numidicum TaxID=680248 RepID=A0ABY8D5E3_9HYPH|nr:acyl-CoA thioesterase [Sinorhizobium numidicum]WEX79685.1 thioesterase family protein [Sinorhizobium numidicum]WEX85362.1 thioesterase family protein [Sinorhizobium numidicum]